MVLYGQSAGSSAVLAYGYAHPESPIVAGLIASSSGIGPTYPTNSSLFHNLAQTANCTNLTSIEELACMQSIDKLELQRLVLSANPDPARALFVPIADNVTLFTNMTDRLRQGLVAKVVGVVVLPRKHESLANYNTVVHAALDNRFHLQRRGGLFTI